MASVVPLNLDVFYAVASLGLRYPAATRCCLGLSSCARSDLAQDAAYGCCDLRSLSAKAVVEGYKHALRQCVEQRSKRYLGTPLGLSRGFKRPLIDLRQLLVVNSSANTRWCSGDAITIARPLKTDRNRGLPKEPIAGSSGRSPLQWRSGRCAGNPGTTGRPMLSFDIAIKQRTGVSAPTALQTSRSKALAMLQVSPSAAGV